MTPQKVASHPGLYCLLVDYQFELEYILMHSFTNFFIKNARHNLCCKRCYVHLTQINTICISLLRCLLLSFVLHLLYFVLMFHCIIYFFVVCTCTNYFAGAWTGTGLRDRAAAHNVQYLYCTYYACRLAVTLFLCRLSSIS